MKNPNLSLSKSTALTERVKLQLRLETYNVFNRVQFAKPDNNTADAGQNDDTTGARQIQLSGKITS
jgi:hypothetical protein